MGVSVEVMKGVFRVSPEKRTTATRSPENSYGFEEYHVEEEGSAELNEGFVWYGDEDLKLKMEGIWPTGYSSFSKKMETHFGSQILVQSALGGQPIVVLATLFAFHQLQRLRRDLPQRRNLLI